MITTARLIAIILSVATTTAAMADGAARKGSKASSAPNAPATSESAKGRLTAQHLPIAALGAACDFSQIDAKGLSIEGTDPNDPSRVYLNLNYTFEPGVEDIVNGKKRSTIIIRERMQVGFFRNWLAEGVSGLAAQVRGSVPDSCSLSRGAATGSILAYAPASFSLKQGMTKRQCSSFDQPCGSPETTCTGGSLGEPPSCSLPSCDWNGCRGGGCSGGRLPEVPTCVTKTKMCRVEQKIDVFSAEVDMRYELPLGVTGTPPSQQIEVNSRIISDGISSSQGELTRLLSDIGLGNIFGVNVESFVKGLRQYVNLVSQNMKSGPQYFPIPTSDYVYLPIVRRNEDVAWVNISNPPVGAVPLGFDIKRDMALPASLACRVGACLRKSKAAGKLLVQSCTL